MKSGSRVIQNRMKEQVPPKPWEQKKQWFVRAASFYGCSVTKAENLYYRQGYTIPNEIYLKLTLRTNPISGDISKNDFNTELLNNKAFRRELEAYKRDITLEIEKNIRERVGRALLNAFSG